jgi:flagellin-like hook-associated protein FlgL
MNVGVSFLSREGKSSGLKLNDAIKKITSGSQMEGTAPSIVQFEKVNTLKSASSNIRIKLNGIQARTTWFQIAKSHLQVIHETVSEMKELSIKAASSVANPTDYRIWNDQFTEMKERISEVVDGFSGQKSPIAGFNSEPLLLNFTPITDLDGNISTELARKDDFNLFTNYQNDAFNTLPLSDGEDKLPLNGVAVNGSVSTITLDTAASAEEEKYLDWKVSIMAGTGVGQEAQILNYDATTRIATFKEDLTVPLDNTSKYVISPPQPLYVNSKYIGTAESGSTTTLELPQEASVIEDAYKGMRVIIRSGSGARQEGIVESYSADNHTVTFQTPLTTAIDNTSEFIIVSDKKNRFLDDLASDGELKFASYVWGADNGRIARLNDDIETFVPVTQEEIDYRAANSIPDTDLDPQTDEEKKERRRLNIFDPEYGTIQTQQGAMRMLGQLENASNQLSLLLTRADAKVGNLSNQYNLLQENLLSQQEALDVIDRVDIAEAIVEMEELSLTQELILPQLMQRITETYKGLNRLLQNQGKGKA